VQEYFALIPNSGFMIDGSTMPVRAVIKKILMTRKL